jgi:hypothetical protein
MSTFDLSTVGLPDFVRNAEITWKKGADTFTSVIRTSGIVKEISIPTNSGNAREFSSIDLELYAKVKNEREAAAFARSQQGYSKVGTLYRVSHAQVITYEMRTQGKYREITTMLMDLLPNVMRRMELDLSHRIGFSSATSYTDMDGRTVDLTIGDGLALASTSHTLRGSSTTYRNILANNPQISRGALEAMEKTRVENSVNQLGQKLPVSDDIIWSSDDPNTVNTIREIMRATATVEVGANAGVPNVYMSKYRHVVLPLVATDNNGGADSTKAKYWGLISSRLSSFMLGIHEEPHVITPLDSDTQSVLTHDWTLSAAGGWMIVIPDAQFFSISFGNGTP